MKKERCHRAQLIRIRLRSQLAFGIVLLGIPSIALAQAGTLDPSYGDDGVFVSAFSSGALGNAARLQSDGKLVVGGEENSGILLRLTPSGALDSTFGSGGVVQAFASGGTGHSAVAVALTSHFGDPYRIFVSGIFGHNTAETPRHIGRALPQDFDHFVAFAGKNHYL